MSDEEWGGGGGGGGARVSNYISVQATVFCIMMHGGEYWAVVNKHMAQ